MTHKQEKLFYACTNFCESFFHMMCKKHELLLDEMFFDGYQRRQIIEFEEKRLMHDFNRLCELCDEIREEMNDNS